MDDINKIIGKNLLALRKQKKLTQMELAEKLNYSDKSISKWETGESLPSIEVLFELSKFYNVTLDDLTNESTPKPETNVIKTKKEKLFPLHLVISLLAVCAVWVLATSLYVAFKISLNKNYYTFFIWAIPLSCVLLIIFNSIWGKVKYLFAILTVLIWTIVAAFFIQFFSYNLWPLFILGVPLQVLVIVSAALVAPKKPKLKKDKNNKEEQKTEDTSEEKAITHKAQIKSQTINNLAQPVEQDNYQEKSEGKIGRAHV